MGRFDRKPREITMLYHFVGCQVGPKMLVRIANGKDPDQMASSEAV